MKCQDCRRQANYQCSACYRLCCAKCDVTVADDVPENQPIKTIVYYCSRCRASTACNVCCAEAATSGERIHIAGCNRLLPDGHGRADMPLERHFPR